MFKGAVFALTVGLITVAAFFMSPSPFDRLQSSPPNNFADCVLHYLTPDTHGGVVHAMNQLCAYNDDGEYVEMMLNENGPPTVKDPAAMPDIEKLVFFYNEPTLPAEHVANWKTYRRCLLPRLSAITAEAAQHATTRTVIYRFSVACAIKAGLPKTLRVYN